MKVRLKCKATTSESHSLDEGWEVVFQEGKWYEFDVDIGFIAANGIYSIEKWQGAIGIGEDGFIARKRSRAEMRATFYYTEIEQKMALRDDKIDKILNNV